MDSSIIAAKKHFLEMRQKKTPNAAVIALADMQQRAHPFLSMVTDGSQVALIGQITLEDETYDPVTKALGYIRQGVDGVSLFTDVHIYSNAMQDLLLVSRALNTWPTVMQNIVVNPYHVAETRAAGASSLVAYASLLDETMLRRVISSAQRWGMTGIIQVSDEQEIEQAKAISPHVIGIGRANAQYFQRDIDLVLLETLRDKMPYNARMMTLGCIKTLEDVQAVVELGVDAIIADETLIRDDETYPVLCELLSRPARY